LSFKNWLKFILLGLIWGSSFLWIKIALREVGPFLLVTMRVGFALLATLAVIAISRDQIPLKKYWKVFLFLGLFNTAVPFVLISWAETHISSGMASILNSTVPLFTIVLAALFLKDDPFTPAKGVGLVVGFGGVVLLMADQLGVGSNSLWGYAGMLLATLSYATSVVFARRRTQGLTPQVQTLGQVGTGFLAIAPAAAVVEAPLNLPGSPLTWLAVAWLGILGTSMATLIFYSLLHQVGPTKTALVTYMFPLVGVLLGIIFLQEKLAWNAAVGAVLIISGIVLVNSKIQRLTNRATNPSPSSDGETTS